MDTNLPPASGIRFGAYSSWARSVTLLSTNSGGKAVVVPSIGGRVVHYGIGEENIFQSLQTNGTVHMPGYQCDIGPEMADLPAHNILWMGVNNWQYKAWTVKTISDPEPALGLQLTKEFKMDRDTGALALTQRMKNISTNEVAYSLWDRTLCVGGGYVFFPINKKSRFKKGWTVHSQWNGSFVFDGSKYVSEEVKPTDNLFMARCQGKATKIAADSDAQWIAYVKGQLLYVKYFPYQADGLYSDGGNTVAVYFDEEVAELQVTSPEITLKPGENYSFPEQWLIFKLDQPVKGFGDIPKLVKKIPEAPFK